jgi:hypothetical protein
MRDVPLPKYRLTLLGRFDLSGPDGPVELPNKKLAGLLAHLACAAPEPQSREKLATLLWGSHVETRVPFAPGGGTDIIARAIAQKLEQRFGNSFVIENPGI